MLKKLCQTLPFVGFLPWLVLEYIGNRVDSISMFITGFLLGIATLLVWIILLPIFLYLDIRNGPEDSKQTLTKDGNLGSQYAEFLKDSDYV